MTHKRIASPLCALLGSMLIVCVALCPAIAGARDIGSGDGSHVNGIPESGSFIVLFKISGKVLDQNGRGIRNARVGGFGPLTGILLADMAGFYAANVPKGWSGTVTVEHAGTDGLLP